MDASHAKSGIFDAMRRGLHACEYPKLHVEHWSDMPKSKSEQGVFSVWRIPRFLTNAVDPFDSLPQAMPFKSHELFDYFLHAHKSDCSTPLSTASIARAFQNETSFRSLFLLAALHYSWNTGHLREYETTYLTHKIGCIRAIKDFINDPGRDPQGWRPRLSSIATLCLTDASTGDLEAAEAHLDGLTALLGGIGTSKPPGLDANDKEKAEHAMVERYILICITELARMRYERDRIKAGSQGASIDMEKTEVSLGAVMPLHKLEDRLAGFWLMPYFVVIEKLEYTDVDGSKHLNNLRFLTGMYGGRYPSTLPTGLSNSIHEEWGMSAAGMKDYFMQGVQNDRRSPSTSSSSPFSDTSISSKNTASSKPPGSTRNKMNCSLPLIFGASLPGKAHPAKNKASTTPPESTRPKRYAMTWNALTITSGFYLYAVLNLGTSPGNISIKGHPLLWVIRILQREADAAMVKLVDERRADVAAQSERPPELLLWILFMGAITVSGLHYMAAAAGYPESNMPGGEATFRELEAWFALRIRHWGKFTGVTAWEGAGGARDFLAAVVWPLQAKVEPLAKAIWEGAVRSEDDEQ